MFIGLGENFEVVKHSSKKEKKNGSSKRKKIIPFHATLPPIPNTPIDHEYNGLIFLFDDDMPFNGSHLPWVVAREQSPPKAQRNIGGGTSENDFFQMCLRNEMAENENVGRNRHILSNMAVEGAELTAT